jgi:hypothetical protein
MFERYTEKARRVIFIARHEASNYGSPVSEAEHLLLGLLRKDLSLVRRHVPTSTRKQPVNASRLRPLYGLPSQPMWTCH